MFTYVEKIGRIGQFDKRNNICMNFFEIPEKSLIILSWITALGLFLSLTEATIKIKFEKINTIRRRQDYVNSLYPKNSI